MLAGFLALLIVAITAIEFKTIGAPGSFFTSILFFAIVNINLVLLLLLVWLLVRNLGKVFIERRKGILGSRLKSKLVFSFLGFAIIPTIILFIISSLYINSSFDRWFSTQIRKTLDAAQAVKTSYFLSIKESTRLAAREIAETTANMPTRSTRDEIAKAIRQRTRSLRIQSIDYYPSIILPPITEWSPAESSADFLSLSSIQDETPSISYESMLMGFSGEITEETTPFSGGQIHRNYQKIQAGPSPALEGLVVATSIIPNSLLSKFDDIALVADDFHNTNPFQVPIKTIYFSLLIVITLLLVFVALWVGVVLARQLTIPLEQLLKATNSVRQGNLDIELQHSGKDELSSLIANFNEMTKELRTQRTMTGKVTSQLQSILSQLPTAVWLIDQHHRLIEWNSATELFIEANSTTGINIEKLLQNELLSPTLELLTECQVTLRATQRIVTIDLPGTADAVKKSISISVHCISLPQEESNFLLFIEDVSELLRLQRETAWREVARRIAHEIKNPLTPIKLSAERLQRRITGLSVKDQSILNQCTAIIIQHTDELRDLVNEFSNFARMPETRMARGSIYKVLHEAFVLYSHAHSEIDWIFIQDDFCPEFYFDQDQLKRVFINLLDNAVAAVLLLNDLKRTIKIETSYNESLRLLQLFFIDSGEGIKQEELSRIFEPYYSTKASGSGLGLAIAKRIINDHRGQIHCISDVGQGTKFIIELPVDLPVGGVNESFLKKP